MKTARHGQALPEYVLIVALGLGVAIGALVLLGQNVNNLFANMLPARNAVASASPAAETAPATAEPQEPTPPAANSPTPSSQQVTATYDPKTGMIQLSGLDGNSGGGTTTSSQGTEAAALGLERLAEIATTDDGQPADPGITSLINQLAQLGHDLAAQEGSLTLPPSKDTNSLAFQEYMDSNLWKTLSDFQTLYESLAQEVGNNPAYTDLMKQVADYSGIISGIATFNYYGQYTAETKKGTPVTQQYLKDNNVGTDITTQPVTVALDPGASTTDSAAGGLDTLAGN